MDRNSPSSHIAGDLRAFFYYRMKDCMVDFHPYMEKVKDDKWLKSVLDSKGGDLDAAVEALVKIIMARKLFGIHSKNYNVDLDKKYSKLIKPVGTDNRGFKVLFADLSKLLCLDSMTKFLKHTFYWMERLERQGNEKVTFVLHHGEGHTMKRAFEHVVLLNETIGVVFPGFIAHIYIFEDFLGSRYRADSLKKDIFHNITFVDETSWSQHFKLDEKYDLSDGYLKLAQKKPISVADVGEKCDKATTALVKQCGGEIKQSQSENGNKEKEQKNKLKQILARLHDVETQVFQLIVEVQELI